jgi:hypothetical protein
VRRSCSPGSTSAPDAILLNTSSYQARDSRSCGRMSGCFSSGIPSSVWPLPPATLSSHPEGVPSARPGISRSRLDASDLGHLLVGGRRDEGSRPGSPAANHSRVFPLGRCRLPPIGFRALSLSKRSPGGRQPLTVWLRLPTARSLGLLRTDALGCSNLRRGRPGTLRQFVSLGVRCVRVSKLLFKTPHHSVIGHSCYLLSQRVYGRHREARDVSQSPALAGAACELSVKTPQDVDR